MQHSKVISNPMFREVLHEIYDIILVEQVKLLKGKWLLHGPAAA